METTQNPGSVWVRWQKQSPAQTRTQGAGVLAGEGADLRGRGEAIQAAWAIQAKVDQRERGIDDGCLSL
jgi:hypothetical protein